MEMIMKILIILLTMLSGLAIAGDGQSAYNIVCRHLTYELDRNKCIDIIRDQSYFDDQALVICANFNFDSYKNQCLGYIAGKQYNQNEINSCRNIPFDFDKLTCLRLSGRQTSGGGNYPCLPKHEVLMQLQAGLNDLRGGNLGTVDKRLQYLIAKFNNPNCQ